MRAPVRGQAVVVCQNCYFDRPWPVRLLRLCPRCEFSDWSAPMLVEQRGRPRYSARLLARLDWLTERELLVLEGQATAAQLAEYEAEQPRILRWRADEDREAAARELVGPDGSCLPTELLRQHVAVRYGLTRAGVDAIVAEYHLPTGTPAEQEIEARNQADADDALASFRNNRGLASPALVAELWRPAI